jgi:hypothetical protein
MAHLAEQPLKISRQGQAHHYVLSLQILQQEQPHCFSACHGTFWEHYVQIPQPSSAATHQAQLNQPALLPRIPRHVLVLHHVPKLRIPRQVKVTLTDMNALTKEQTKERR